MTRPRNAFLQSLSDASFEALSSHLTSVELDLAQVVHRDGSTIDYVYFPETALLSTITQSHDGRGAETCMIGNEGVSGLPQACGSGQITFTSIVQVDGLAFRAPAAVVGPLCGEHPDLARRAWTAVESQLAESRQSLLCMALHPVEDRLARWLLESHERSARRNPLPLTQEFLAAMLGVQRTTVTAIAQDLRSKGLISYARGRIAIHDLAGLEAASCECHAETRDIRAQLALRSPTADEVGDLLATGLRTA